MGIVSPHRTGNHAVERLPHRLHMPWRRQPRRNQPPHCRGNDVDGQDGAPQRAHRPDVYQGKVGVAVRAPYVVGDDVAIALTRRLRKPALTIDGTIRCTVGGVHCSKGHSRANQSDSNDGKINSSKCDHKKGPSGHLGRGFDDYSGHLC